MIIHLIDAIRIDPLIVFYLNTDGNYLIVEYYAFNVKKFARWLGKKIVLPISSTCICETILTLSVLETKISEFAISVDLNEVAHNEPPHLDLHCLSSSL